MKTPPRESLDIIRRGVLIRQNQRLAEGRSITDKNCTAKNELFSVSNLNPIFCKKDRPTLARISQLNRVYSGKIYAINVNRLLDKQT